MNQKEFNEVIIRQMDRCKSMLVAKGAEYAPRAVKNTAVDRLAHFKKAAVVLNTTPRAALMGMLSKHLISVSDMCMGEQQYSKEQWDEKITDSINYFLILCAIVEEEPARNILSVRLWNPWLIRFTMFWRPCRRIPALPYIR